MTEEEQRINQRLDALQEMKPTKEVTEEYCALLRELRRFRPQPKPPRSFHRACHEMRVLIWLAGGSLCLATLFVAPFFMNWGGNYAAIGVFMLFGSIASLCWAIWSSTSKP